MECGGCDGTESVEEEDGRRLESDRLQAACAILGREMAEAERRFVNSIPEGDGYGLCAAESGLSESDYLHSRCYDMAAQAQGALGGIDTETRAALVALLVR
jgi:hypothetical protein